jgi:hypothetical protein
LLGRVVVLERGTTLLCGLRLVAHGIAADITHQYEQSERTILTSNDVFIGEPTRYLPGELM